MLTLSKFIRKPSCNCINMNIVKRYMLTSIINNYKLWILLCQIVMSLKIIEILNLQFWNTEEETSFRVTLLYATKENYK